VSFLRPTEFGDKLGLEISPLAPHCTLTNNTAAQAKHCKCRALLPSGAAAVWASRSLRKPTGGSPSFLSLASQFLKTKVYCAWLALVGIQSFPSLHRVSKAQAHFCHYSQRDKKKAERSWVFLDYRARLSGSG
jgi:acyl-CoA synthetase (NDP forming)